LKKAETDRFLRGGNNLQFTIRGLFEDATIETVVS
jgi:hypothetical protein